ncbi:MAG: SPOR domain-containing protein [Rhodobacteraceae bacterium]|nr:SPOR domain-containing protein [Paracoccaceae bacterium]
MAEIDFDGGIATDGSGLETAANALNWLAAALSLALIVGLGIWGWQLVQRDATGVPVVRAMEGPMRITPEAPGGREAAHQGLAVNSIAAEDAASVTPEQVVLAPDDLALTEEDASLTALLEQAEFEAVTEAAPAMETQSATDLAVAAALADFDATIASAVLTSEEEVASDKPISVGTLTVSPRPAPRPVRIALAGSATLNVEPSLDVTADQVPAGERLVQLGAFVSPEVATEEWNRLNANFDGYLDGKQRLIQQAEAGGKTFYRLRVVGFDDLSDANRFCSVLVAGNASCIPIVNR